MSSRFEHTGNLFSVDLLDASGEIRGTFFKETADKVFPLLEEGKVYTFQETSGRLKPANKQVRSRRPVRCLRLVSRNDGSGWSLFRI